MTARSYRLHPRARAELDGAAERYDERLPGLGIEFLDAVADAFELILERPEAWQRDESLAHPTVRRFVMARFPFSIVYYLAGDIVRIVAVAHGHQEPGYWRSRTREE